MGKSAVILKLIILIPVFLIEVLHAWGNTETDTASINLLTRNALLIARRNPDLSIALATKALGESNDIHYVKGEADASLALGSAWLAKYNPGDSALFYNTKAYDLYRELDDSRGKGRACFNLAYVFSIKGNLQEAERYGSLSLSFFESAGDNRGLFNAYNMLSYLAKQQKDLQKASALIREAINIASRTGDTLSLADATNSLGNIYKDMALFRLANDAYFDALKLWEMKGDSAGIAIAYGSIGLAYYYQQDWNKAMEYFQKKVPLSMKRNDLWELSKTYNNIAQIYIVRASYDSALYFLRKALLMNHIMNYPSGIASVNNNISSLFLSLSMPDSALWYIKKAIEISENIGDKESASYYITLGNVYRSKGDNNRALQSLLKAYESGRKLQLPLIVHNASIILSNIYSDKKQWALAYKYLKEHYELTDSIKNDEHLKQVTRLELQYDFDKKQRAAEYDRMKERMMHENRIRQQKSVMGGLVILVIFIAILSLSIIRHNRLRGLYARIDLEQRLLRAQLNPHFIFNSLCAVQDLILSGKLKNANTYLTKIARLMRNILENSRQEFIPLDKEIETIKLYLELQQLRFENGFEYDINIDPSVDTSNISIPPMFTQPCIENSIEHGLLPGKDSGRLEISYKINDDLLRLEVTDNGVGRKESEALQTKENKQSISTTIARERIEKFRKTLRQKKISYEIIDLYDNGKASGTKVVMMLPYKKIYA